MSERDPPITTATFADLCTLRLGGSPKTLVTAGEQDELIEACRAADETEEPVLVFGGASNLVVGDHGFAGTALRVATKGVFRSREPDGRVLLEVAAGEPWDAFVKTCVADGLAGVEALAGIPGTVGATPIQNVGAYDQEVAESIVQVHAYDRALRKLRTLAAGECGFAYRRSVFQADPDRFLVLRVDFRLASSRESAELTNSDVREALELPDGATAPTGQVRDAVLGLRRERGMVLDNEDPDTWSVGSFFKNPVFSFERFQELRTRAEELEPGCVVPGREQPDGRIRSAAAWLIQHSGFEKGYPLTRWPHAQVALSRKHVLALTNRGNGTTTELLALAREVAGGVQRTFGVVLDPEPVPVGVADEEWPQGQGSERIFR